MNHHINLIHGSVFCFFIIKHVLDFRGSKTTSCYLCVGKRRLREINLWLLVMTKPETQNSLTNCFKIHKTETVFEFNFWIRFWSRLPLCENLRELQRAVGDRWDEVEGRGAQVCAVYELIQTLQEVVNDSRGVAGHQHISSRPDRHGCRSSTGIRRIAPTIQKKNVWMIQVWKTHPGYCRILPACRPGWLWASEWGQSEWERRCSSKSSGPWAVIEGRGDVKWEASQRHTERVVHVQECIHVTRGVYSGKERKGFFFFPNFSPALLSSPPLTCGCVVSSDEPDT